MSRERERQRDREREREREREFIYAMISPHCHILRTAAVKGIHECLFTIFGSQAKTQNIAMFVSIGRI